MFNTLEFSVPANFRSSQASAKIAPANWITLYFSVGKKINSNFIPPTVSYLQNLIQLPEDAARRRQERHPRGNRELFSATRTRRLLVSNFCSAFFYLSPADVDPHLFLFFFFAWTETKKKKKRETYRVVAPDGSWRFWDPPICRPHQNVATKYS